MLPMSVWGGNHRSFIITLQVCQYLVEWSLLLVWGLVGDAKDSSLSTFCMVELVGHSFFQCLEYGTGMFYVVNLEGTQCPKLLSTLKELWTFWSLYWLGLCLSGLVFGVLRIVLLCLSSLILLAFPFDLFASAFL